MLLYSHDERSTIFMFVIIYPFLLCDENSKSIASAYKEKKDIRLQVETGSIPCLNPNYGLLTRHGLSYLFPLVYTIQWHVIMYRIYLFALMLSISRSSHVFFGAAYTFLLRNIPSPNRICTPTANFPFYLLSLTLIFFLHF